MKKDNKGTINLSMQSQYEEAKKELARLKNFARGYLAGMYNRDLPIYRVSIAKRREIFSRIAKLEKFCKSAQDLKEVIESLNGKERCEMKTEKTKFECVFTNIQKNANRIKEKVWKVYDEVNECGTKGTNIIALLETLDKEVSQIVAYIDGVCSTSKAMVAYEKEVNEREV